MQAANGGILSGADMNQKDDADVSKSVALRGIRFQNRPITIIYLKVFMTTWCRKGLVK